MTSLPPTAGGRESPSGSSDPALRFDGLSGSHSGWRGPPIFSLEKAQQEKFKSRLFPHYVCKGTFEMTPRS